MRKLQPQQGGENIGPQVQKVDGDLCRSYMAGHHTHWIPAIKIYAEAERIPVELDGPIENGWFTVRVDGTNERWWHHDLGILEHFLPCQGERVGATTFITIPVPGGSKWVYAARHESPCSTGRQIS